MIRRAWFVLGALGAVASCSLGLDGYTGGSTGESDASASVKTDASDAAPACVLPPDDDVTMDSHNCGVCGRDCLGGECQAGKCQMRVLATDFVHPLGGTKLYVSSNNGIDELDLDGNNRRSVVSGLSCNYVVANDTDGRS